MQEKQETTQDAIKRVIPVIAENESRAIKHQQPLTGRVHSLESFGTVDGPGIRFVVFFQGCLMRCRYCHNRDTWDRKAGMLMTVDQIMAELRSYKHFIMPHGGVTATGGEAMLQVEFVRDWFRACHAEGFHTCLDTNGYVRKYTPAVDELLAVTDLVLLDIKQMKNDVHRKLVGVSNEYTLAFAQYLEQKNLRTWIRYVVVPGWTDDDESVMLLGAFLQGMSNIEKVELLPYHELGKHKWLEQEQRYRLEGVSPPSKESLQHIKKTLENYHLTVSI